MARHPERDYGKTLTDAVGYFLISKIKDINTTIPGNIVEYDAETRRAVIQIAIKVVLDDMSELERPVIYDVPIIFPAGNNYSLFIRLIKDDPVLLIFSQRGITEFKKEFKMSKPDMDSLFSTADAMAIPGFGPTLEEGLTEVDDEPNFTIQDYQGRKYLAFKSDSEDSSNEWLRIKYEDHIIEMNEDHILIDFDDTTDGNTIEMTEDYLRADFDGKTIEITPDHIEMDFDGKSIEITSGAINIDAGGGPINFNGSQYNFA